MDYAYIMNIQLPEQMHLEGMPEPVDIKSGGLTFRHVVNFDATSRMLTVHANYAASETVFSPDAYANLQPFFEQSLKAEDATLILKSN
jgi:hypothetical protein